MISVGGAATKLTETSRADADKFKGERAKFPIALGDGGIIYSLRTTHSTLELPV